MLGIEDLKEEEVSVIGGVTIREDLRCTKLHVIIVAKIVRSLSNPLVASLFFAAIVLIKLKKMILINSVEIGATEVLGEEIQEKGVLMIEIR